jgi:hypothetical protein
MFVLAKNTSGIEVVNRQIWKRRRDLKDDADVVIWRQLSSASGLRRRLGRFHDAKIQFSRPL